MELFERVKQLREDFGSMRKMADILGIRSQKLNSYLNTTSQKNLWQHLPKILETHPEISEDWLFLGKGPKLVKDRDAQQQTENLLEKQVRELTESNRILAETNGRLVAELLELKGEK